MEMTAVEESMRALCLKPPPGTANALFVENRQQAKFDRALAGNGLLVWSVSDTPPGIRLVPAGGPFDPKKRGTSDDPFPGSKHVTQAMTDGLQLSEISDSNRTMRVTVTGLPSPRGRPTRHPA